MSIASRNSAMEPTASLSRKRSCCSDARLLTPSERQSMERVTLQIHAQAEAAVHASPRRFQVRLPIPAAVDAAE